MVRGDQSFDAANKCNNVKQTADKTDCAFVSYFSVYNRYDCTMDQELWTEIQRANMSHARGGLARPVC